MRRKIAVPSGGIWYLVPTRPAQAAAEKGDPRHRVSHKMSRLWYFYIYRTTCLNIVYSILICIPYMYVGVPTIWNFPRRLFLWWRPVDWDQLLQDSWLGHNGSQFRIPSQHLVVMVRWWLLSRNPIRLQSVGFKLLCAHQTTSIDIIGKDII